MMSALKASVDVYIENILLFLALKHPSSLGGKFSIKSHIFKKMLAFNVLFALAGLLATVSAAPAPIPNGGQGARLNDTPPVYHTMTDCTFFSRTHGLKY